MFEPPCHILIRLLWYPWNFNCPVKEHRLVVASCLLLEWSLEVVENGSLWWQCLLQKTEALLEHKCLCFGESCEFCPFSFGIKLLHERMFKQCLVVFCFYIMSDNEEHLQLNLYQLVNTSIFYQWRQSHQMGWGPN